MKLKPKMSMKILATIKKGLTLAVFKLIQNTISWPCDRKFFGLKPKMYPYLRDYIIVHKRAKGVNKNVVVAVSHNEY